MATFEQAPVEAGVEEGRTGTRTLQGTAVKGRPDPSSHD